MNPTPRRSAHRPASWRRAARLRAAAATCALLLALPNATHGEKPSEETSEQRGPALGTWEPRAPMPTARQELGVGLLDGAVYVVGGVRRLGAVGEHGRALRRRDEHVGAGRGSSRRAAAQPRRRGAAGRKLCAVGGLTQQFAAVDSVFCYDPAANTWTRRASLPLARGAMGVAESNGLIYAAGGLPSGRNRQFAVYHPDSNVWRPLPMMPTGGTTWRPPRSMAVSTRSPAEPDRWSGAMEVFDPATEAWRALAPIPTPARRHRGGRGRGADHRIRRRRQSLSAAGRLKKWRSTRPPRTLGERWNRCRSRATASAWRRGWRGDLVPGGGPVQGFSSTTQHDAFLPPPPLDPPAGLVVE
jgi:hypothetical protein